MNMNDFLYVSVDFSNNDSDCMLVMREKDDVTYVVNKFTDEEARSLYKKLIGVTCKNCIHCKACDMMYEHITRKSLEGREYPIGAEKCKCFEKIYR